MPGRLYAPDTPCQVCGLVPRQRKGLTRGRCAACYFYWMRHGRTTERPTEARRCQVCGAPHHAHGYCRYHNHWLAPGVRERHLASERAYRALRRAQQTAS